MVQPENLSSKRNWFKRFDGFDAGIIIFLLASYLIVAQLPFAPKKFGDDVFFNEAKTIAQFLHGAKDWEEIIITRAPGPVLFYVIPYAALPVDASDHSYWLAGLFWTIAFISLATLLIRRASALIMDESSGKLAALLTLLTPFPVYYSYGVSAEPLAYFSVAVACFGWAKWRFSTEAGASSGLVVACIGLVLLILARPNAILVLGIGLFAGLVLMVKSRYSGKELKSLAAIVLVCGISVASLFLFTAFSNGKQSDTFYLAAFPGRFQYRTEPWDWRFWDNATRTGSADYEYFRQEKEALEERAETSGTPLAHLKKEWIVQDYLEHPDIALRQFGVRLLSLHVWLINSKPVRAFGILGVPGWVGYSLFHLIVNGVYFLILAGSLIFLFRNRSNIAQYWVLWATHISLLIFHALIYAEPRYLFPSLPGLTIMASVGLLALYRKPVFRGDGLPQNANLATS